MTFTHLTIGQQKIAAAQRPEADSYWRNVLLGANASTFRSDAQETHHSDSNQLLATIQFGTALSERLKAGSRHDSSALNLILSTAVAGLIHFYTEDDDILIYTPATVGRAYVPMRVAFLVEDTFRSIWGRMQEAVLSASPHLDFPIDLIGPAPKVTVALSDLHSLDATNSRL